MIAVIANRGLGSGFRLRRGSGSRAPATATGPGLGEALFQLLAGGDRPAGDVTHHPARLGEAIAQIIRHIFSQVPRLTGLPLELAPSLRATGGREEKSHRRPDHQAEEEGLEDRTGFRLDIDDFAFFFGRCHTNHDEVSLGAI